MSDAIGEQAHPLLDALECRHVLGRNAVADGTRFVTESGEAVVHLIQYFALATIRLRQVVGDPMQQAFELVGGATLGRA